MKKTVTFTYEEEKVVVDAIIDKLIEFNKELATWEAASSDYSTAVERQLCASRLADGIKEKMRLLSEILDRMSGTSYDLEEDEG